MVAAAAAAAVVAKNVRLFIVTSLRSCLESGKR
jgi:hypothetical protein